MQQCNGRAMLGLGKAHAGICASHGTAILRMTFGHLSDWPGDTLTKDPGKEAETLLQT